MRRRFRVTQAARQVRQGDKETLTPRTDVKGGCDALFEDRFFHEIHAVVLRAACQQLLWSLEHEIPTQMRKDNEIEAVFGCHGYRGRASAIPAFHNVEGAPWYARCSERCFQFSGFVRGLRRRCLSTPAARARGLVIAERRVALPV